MKASILSTTGSKQEEVELPLVFSTKIRKDLIHQAYINLETHKFQRQGHHLTAGMDVAASSLDPPTGHGQSRVAKMHGGGGGRQGEAGGVGSVRGGRIIHPPKVEKVIYKKLNKKENKLALSSALAATTSKELTKSRGHIVDGLESFPILVSDEIEDISKTKDLITALESLKLLDDVNRLSSRKGRSGKSVLRGRAKKIGKSVLFVVNNKEKLVKSCGSIPGVDCVEAKNLSVLDLAPGAKPIRLTVFSKKALEDLSKIKSPHLELMVKVK